VDRATIQRHIRSGRLSKEIGEAGAPQIDLSELARVYPAVIAPAADAQAPSAVTLYSRPAAGGAWTATPLAQAAPEAGVAIQVSGTFGSRQEEAQRLGRVLRPKGDGRTARFYAVVVRDTVDADFAAQVADGLGLETMPKPAPAARKIVAGLPPSPALSILGNPPRAISGRKIGVLVSDGTDARLLAALQAEAKSAGVVVELIAPKVSGVKLSDGKTVPAQQKVNGGPSVLYDAVAVLPSAAGAKLLAMEATARDFVNDAYAHAKFIGHADTAQPLFDKAGLTERDGGFIPLRSGEDVAAFLKAFGALRFWERETKVHAV
jgi:hypothetical protein